MTYKYETMIFRNFTLLILNIGDTIIARLLNCILCRYIYIYTHTCIHIYF